MEEREENEIKKKANECRAENKKRMKKIIKMKKMRRQKRKERD